MAPKQDQIKLVKCPHCPVVIEQNDLPPHIKVIHRIARQIEYDSKGKMKMFVCASCAPLPMLFSTQGDLNQHKMDKKHI